MYFGDSDYVLECLLIDCLWHSYMYINKLKVFQSHSEEEHGFILVELGKLYALLFFYISAYMLLLSKSSILERNFQLYTISNLYLSIDFKY